MCADTCRETEAGEDGEKQAGVETGGAREKLAAGSVARELCCPCQPCAINMSWKPIA